MDPVRQAAAIVYFRALKSIGVFHPIWGTKDFIFTPCTCRRFVCSEKIPNGLPEPLLREHLKDIISDFRLELGQLCRDRYFEKEA